MLENKPLVSIGMPIFNGMRPDLKNNINLEKALQSILTQSYKNLEIIISDNC
jgi:glycosyltransferase involved in cell wall biosynthesis